jgi:hypothetical protein
VFLVQILQKLWKIHSEVHIQGKKNFGKCVPNFKIKGKNGNPGGKRVMGGGKRKFRTALLLLLLSGIAR